MYRLAAEGVLPHTRPMYRRLSSQLAQARREGRFPDLIDTMREVHVPPAWPSAGAFVAEMPAWFRLDRTAGQEHALYVAAEKDTLRQQLTGWLEFAGIPVFVVRGFSSQSYADVVRHRVAHEQRQACLLVVGDFDCSGEDIEWDWVERTGCWSSVTRVLLTYEQMRAYELPATEGKRGDPQWPAFARRYGFDIERPVQWEVEALEPDELQRLVLGRCASTPTAWAGRWRHPGRFPTRSCRPQGELWSGGTRSKATNCSSFPERTGPGPSLPFAAAGRTGMTPTSTSVTGSTSHCPAGRPLTGCRSGSNSLTRSTLGNSLRPVCLSSTQSAAVVCCPNLTFIEQQVTERMSTARR
ncbi:hypothetical protein [Streptomyces sp. NPDC058612]|uniref:hypothetical protein n=1 Tax=Streptomyces sp. NPDC058612 TaxID=3346555 RepID=UPI00364A26CC